MAVPALAAIGAGAALAGGALLLASRWRVRRMLDQLPRLQLGPNKLGVSAQISPVGASILKLVVPAADGAPVDVVLGFERASTYAVRCGATVAPSVTRRPALPPALHLGLTAPLAAAAAGRRRALLARGGAFT